MINNIKIYIFFVFVFLFCFSRTAFSRSYMPFPLQNSLWSYGVYDGNCTGPWNYCGQVLLRFQGDTVLNNILYQKLYTSFIGSPVIANYAAAIRQDTVEGNLYIIFATGQCNYSDTLLYSFLWNVTDTLKQCDEILGGLYSTIKSIDSINIAGQWRKRITLQNTYLTELIEGIGSNTGLIGPWNGWIGGEMQLECFELNGVSVYPNSTCGTNSIGNSQFNQSDIIIYPAIVTDLLFIQVDNIYINSLNVDIINVNGVVTKNIKLNSESANKYSISTINIPQGMYFLRVNSETQNLENKKIIIFR